MQNVPAKRGQSHRLRRARWSQPNQLYHLRLCTRRRIPAFLDFQAARTVVRCMRTKDRNGHASTVAFVVMPDHVHWLCSLGYTMSLSKLVASLKADVTFALRGRDDLPRPLWQSGYFDRGIREFEDSVGVARYIVMNPVRAGLVRTVREYPHWDCIWVQN